MALLSGPERELYEAQPRADRDHSVRCALAVLETLGTDASTEVVVASALHDVGKTEARLGTFGRVGATLVGAMMGRRRMSLWADRPGGLRRRFGIYVSHPRIGASMLAGAGSADLVVDWTRNHHVPERSAIPAAELHALGLADRT